MRGTAAALFILPVLALTAAGCGGSQISADEVSVEPPTLTIPKDSKLVGQARSKASATATPSSSADPAATTAAGTTGATTGGATTTAPGTTGGTAAQPQTQAPAQEPANTGGASADQDFDEFCANNPGAC